VSTTPQIVAALRLTRGFGDGWMTGNASDLARIAIFAGFDAADLVRAIHRIHPSSERLVNARTVERALAALEGK
jgi:hypothetical protein